MPLHLEVRATYVLGEKPFASKGFRPYGAFALGIAEVDSHVAVDYFVDEAGFNSGNKGTLDAWRKTGKSFAAPAVGTRFAFGGASAITAELRLLLMLGTFGLAPAINVGYAHGL